MAKALRIATQPENALALIEALETKIATTSDPQDASYYYTTCEAYAKLYGEDEETADRFTWCAVLARRRWAELVEKGRKDGLIQTNGGDRKISLKY